MSDSTKPASKKRGRDVLSVSPLEDAAPAVSPVSPPAVFNFFCNEGGCAYKSKAASTMRLHKANIHGIDLKHYPCDEVGCGHRAKEKGSLKRHKANVHNIDVIWHDCTETVEVEVDAEPPSGVKGKGRKGGKGKDAETGKRSKSKAAVPPASDGSVMLQLCKFKTKLSGDLKRHKQMVHGLEAQLYSCTAQGCNYSTKKKSNLKEHVLCRHHVVLTTERPPTKGYLEVPFDPEDVPSSLAHQATGLAAKAAAAAAAAAPTNTASKETAAKVAKPKTPRAQLKKGPELPADSVVL